MPTATSDVEMLDRLADARSQTDELFDLIQPDALYERPIPERHRIIFYIGHLEAFDWNLLRERLLDLRAFDPALDKLFAFGIDPVDGGLPADQPNDWPSLRQVRDYVWQVRQALGEGLEKTAGSGSSKEFRPDFLLNVAIEHRLMHAETLAYMLHQLPLSQKSKPLSRSDMPSLPFQPRMIEIPAGAATLGISRNSGTFGWDNEFEETQVEVPPFAIDQFKVTNGEFLVFLRAGGYERPEFWNQEDWSWRTAQNIGHPAFWKRSGERWYLRTMFEEVRLPLDWPVYVSHAEASAYARWAGKGLPTEAQWHRATYGTPFGDERAFPWGEEPPSEYLGNFDLQHWDPTPVTGFPKGQSAFGVSDLLGNAWEWTSTKFGPLPGFQQFSFYPGYSANFFDGKHHVLKGGSPRTAACMLRRSFRNWFQAHYQYVYAGFRCVTN